MPVSRAGEESTCGPFLRRVWGKPDLAAELAPEDRQPGPDVDALLGLQTLIEFKMRSRLFDELSMAHFSKLKSVYENVTKNNLVTDA